MARKFPFKVQDAGTTTSITVRHGEHLEVEVTGLPVGATAALAIAGDGDDDPLIEYGSGGVMTVTPAQLAAKGIIEGKPYAYNIWHGPSTDPTWLFEGTFLLKGSILPLQWLGEGAQPTPAPTAAGAIPDQTYTQNSAITSLNVASDFTGSGITYALAPSSAALPAGLTLSSAGIISGTPTGTNTARTIVVRGTNASGFADSGFSVTVNAAADTTAPTITGPATVNVPENTTAVGTYTANETVTWSLSGVDAARFAITSGGVLSFASAPDYETPTDNGANNVYDVVVTGTDAAGNVGTRAVAVTVTDVAEGGGATPGIALYQGAGQSNMGSLGNTVAQLPTADMKIYPNISSYDNSTDTLGGTMAVVNYVLAQSGQTIDGKAGPYGERSVIQDGEMVGPTFGIAHSIDAGTLLGEQTETRFFKATSPGVRLSYYQGQGDTASYDSAYSSRFQGWKHLGYARRKLRADVAASATPFFRQAFIWWQGEANARLADANGSTADAAISTYATEFQKVYDQHKRVTGDNQPPWFIIQLLPVWRTASAARDPYTDAMNVALKAMCGNVVDVKGGTYNGITTKSGNANWYFVEHDIQDKLTIQSEDPHITAPQQKFMGQMIGSALKTIHGGTGYTTAYPLTEVLPDITGVAASVMGTTLTVTGFATDPGTVRVALVPTGAAAPTKAQIMAGTGGGIVASTSVTITDTAPGAAVSVAVTGAGGTTYDWYACLQVSSGQISSGRKGTSTLGSVVRSWDTTINSGSYSYTNADRTVTYVSGSALYAQSRAKSATGKRYFEVLVGGTSNPSYVGVLRENMPNNGGGSAGTDKAGFTAAILQYTGGQVNTGSNLVPGDVVQIAVDVDAKTMWARKNNTGDWNFTAGHDPSAGTGGLSISGLTGAIMPTASVFTDDSVTLRADPADWGFTAPTGFGAIG